MAKRMKGVSCIERNVNLYWYAMVDDCKVYCGKGVEANKLAVAQVEADDLERYREPRRSQGNAYGTTNVEVSLLSAAHNLAYRRKKIPVKDDPPGELARMDDTNPRPILSAESMKAYCELLTGTLPMSWWLLLESAMISGEICNLRVYQAHLDEVVSEVPKQVAGFIDLGIFEIKSTARHKFLEAYHSYVKLGPVCVMRLVDSKTDTNEIQIAENAVGYQVK